MKRLIVIVIMPVVGILFGYGFRNSQVRADLSGEPGTTPDLSISADSAAPGRHPNVLFLLTDDQRFSVIGALGREAVLTPNMDRLMRHGVTFTQNHIMGGLQGAICAPSRAMLMTSRTLFHQHHDGEYIPAEDIILPEYFRSQGYTTFETGKWHNGRAAINRGFSEGDNIFFGGMHSPEEGGHWKPLLHHYDSTGAYKGGFRGDHFSSIYYADAAIGFLDEQKNATRPFFAYVAFTGPHDPPACSRRTDWR